MNVLAGDIGGTTARLALVDASGPIVHITHSRRYKSREFSGLTPIVRAFLEEIEERPERACFGIAGPVRNGRCTMTNLSWTVDVRALAAETELQHTVIVNDLVAAGYGLQRLPASDLVTLQSGTAVASVHGTKALIAAGTGLGQAFVTWDHGDYIAHASEGGHASFAARNHAEWRLVRFLTARFGEVSCERVICGTGLVNIYRYLCSDNGGPQLSSVGSLKPGADPAAFVTELALHDADPVASQSLDMFMAAYGAQAANFALSVLATGGVYLGGGIAPRIVNKLGNGTFLRAFLDKGRLSPTLARMPVHIVMNPNVGLIGAGILASRH